jgi:hypothetical protein
MPKKARTILLVAQLASYKGFKGIPLPAGNKKTLRRWWGGGEREVGVPPLPPSPQGEGLFLWLGAYTRVKGGRTIVSMSMSMSAAMSVSISIAMFMYMSMQVQVHVHVNM